MISASITHSLIEQIWTVSVGIVLAVWFLASLIHQFRFAWWRGVTRFDFFHLLPRWTFFAPNPGRHNFHLVFRDWIDGHPGPWVEITVSSDDRRWRWFWHPARYPSKGLSDLVNSLYRSLQSSREVPQALMLSSAYFSYDDGKKIDALIDCQQKQSKPAISKMRLLI